MKTPNKEGNAGSVRITEATPAEGRNEEEADAPRSKKQRTENPPGVSAGPSGEVGKKEKMKKKAKEMDFSKYPKVHVAFRIAYHGQTHDGLAKQENSENTIENHFVQALIKLRLIPPSTNEVEKFSRCGRTDKGVSAFGNAFSLMVRGAKEGDPPLNYARLVNKCLPLTIRVVGTAIVPLEFDARFSCVTRTYRYYFATALYPNVGAMKEGARLLLGKHDFRNFCKMDVVNVSNFVRDIYEVEYCPIEEVPGVAYFKIRGNAFLYHQIRCIMAVLFLIGRELESPSVISDMLDLTKVAAKPCYEMADDAALVLWDCHFDGVEWEMEDEDRERWVCEIIKYTTTHLIAAAVGSEMLKSLGRKVSPTNISFPTSGAGGGGRYIPLLDPARGVEFTFEEKVAALSAKKKEQRAANIAKGGSK